MQLQGRIALLIAVKLPPVYRLFDLKLPSKTVVCGRLTISSQSGLYSVKCPHSLQATERLLSQTTRTSCADFGREQVMLLTN